MAVCQNCGTDHDQELLEDTENYTHLEEAWNALASANDKANEEGGNGSREIVPAHISKFMRRQNLAHQDTLYQYVMEYGPGKGPDLYIEMMMEVVFCLGVMTHARYSMPDYSVTEEKVEENRVRFQQMIEEHQNQPPVESLRDALMKTLEGMGIDPSRVKIAELPEIPQSASEGDDENGSLPGMYL
jgi:hypothetical protein